MHLPARPYSRPQGLVVILTISTVTFLPPMAKAQEHVSSEFLGVVQLDPITINGQDDPLNFSSVHEGEDIEKGRLRNFEDVLRATPGIGVNSSGGTNLSTIYIRGVGSMYPMSLDDSAATFTLDGSPLSARHISLGTLDAERIEVLKGPQGTKSSAAALAGTVNVITAKPSRVQEGYLRSEIGQEGQYLLEGAVGGPLSETLSGRASADDAATRSCHSEILHQCLSHDLAGRRSSGLWCERGGGGRRDGAKLHRRDGTRRR